MPANLSVPCRNHALATLAFHLGAISALAGARATAARCATTPDREAERHAIRMQDCVNEIKTLASGYPSTRHANTRENVRRLMRKVEGDALFCQIDISREIQNIWLDIPLLDIPEA